MAGRVVASMMLVLLAVPAVFAQTVRIGVLGLFHPHEITLSAARGEAIVVTAGDNVFVLEPGARTGTAHIRAAGDRLVLESGGQLVHATEILAGGRNGRRTSTNRMTRTPSVSFQA